METQKTKNSQEPSKEDSVELTLDSQTDKWHRRASSQIDLYIKENLIYVRSGIKDEKEKDGAFN